MKYSWPKFDWVLIVCAVLLVSVGLAAIYSATLDENSLEFARQLQMAGVGAIVFLGCSFIDSSFWSRYAAGLYAVMLALLGSVLFCGTSVNGAQRWVSLGSIGYFQPSEIAKLLLLLVMARFMAGANDGVYGQRAPLVRKFIFAMILVFIPMLMVLKQPDLGTALVTAIVGISIIAVGNVPLWWVFSCVGAGAAVIPFILHDYQKQRIMTFLHPEEDLVGSGWNIVQAKIAIGSGGIWGKGLFMGTQNRLKFVPEHHTDFIFTIIGEELGLIGCLCVILLLAVLVGRAFQVACATKSAYTCMVATGIGVFWAVHAVVNIGMTTGILPVVGSPLPFVSFGGTALITNCAALGILNYLSVRRRS